MCVYLYRRNTNIVKMETIAITEISIKKLKELVSEMILDNTLDSLQSYHDSNFINTEYLEKEDCFLSMKVAVDTRLKNDEIIIENVYVIDEELWINEEEVELTEQMIIFLNKEITNKVKELI